MASWLGLTSPANYSAGVSASHARLIIGQQNLLLPETHPLCSFVDDPNARFSFIFSCSPSASHVKHQKRSVHLNCSATEGKRKKKGKRHTRYKWSRPDETTSITFGGTIIILSSSANENTHPDVLYQTFTGLTLHLSSPLASHTVSSPSIHGHGVSSS